MSLKRFGVALILMVISSFFIQCGGGSESSASADVLLKNLPDNATGVVLINFKKIADLNILNLIKENAKKEDGEKTAGMLSDLDEFISATGFDPQKDLVHAAVAMFGSLDESKPKTIFLAQGNFNPEKFITYAKTKTAALREETYSGVVLYLHKNQEKELFAVSFPKTGLIAMGDIEQLKKTLDIIQGKGRSLVEMPLYMVHLKKANADALLTGAFLLPDKVRTLQETMKSPFEFDLSKAQALTVDLFYGNDIWSGALHVISANPEGNKKTASTLNNLKNMAVMLGPEVGDIVNGLAITGTDTQIELKFSITKEQLEKLKVKAKEKMQSAVETSSSEVETK